MEHPLHQTNHIAILGLGNVLLRDEGAGVSVINELKSKFVFSPPIPLLDGGTLGFSLINEIQDCTKLIIIDAVKTGEPPGTLYRFTREDIETKISHVLSAHDVGFMEVLEQWQMAGVSPEIIFFGIEPEDIRAWGTELTATVQAKIPRLVELVLQELHDSGVRTEPIATLPV
jgi:hydrogenase maturation protease